jgi:hypothetical protein
MFNVLHGPSFQLRYNAFIQNPTADDPSWLALVFTILAIAVNTLDYNDPVLAGLRSQMPMAESTSAISAELRKASLTCLSRDNFIFNYRFHTLECLLLLIYGISHDQGVDVGWTLLGKPSQSIAVPALIALGLALNMGIALGCNTADTVPGYSSVDIERRCRCWAGILMLHTYQAVLFKDIDLSSLLHTNASLPFDVDDNQLGEYGITQQSTSSIGMLVMKFKIRLFRLSSRICRELRENSQLDEIKLDIFDSQVAKERTEWDTAFLLYDSPCVLEPSTYAHWCILQVYAHQLYLLLHRPFCHSRENNKSRYRPASRAKCIASGAALIDLQRQFLELPRLRPYRWLLYGMIGFCSIHGAMALASCLLEEPDEDFDSAAYRVIFDAGVDRVALLQTRSSICAKVYPVLCHLR